MKKKDKVAKQVFWTKEDDILLKKLWPMASWEELIKAFPNRSRRAITGHSRDDLKLKRENVKDRRVQLKKLLLKALDKSVQSCAEFSKQHNLSKGEILDIASELASVGYDIQVSRNDKGDHVLELVKGEKIHSEATPISLNNRRLRIAFIAEPRFGVQQEQISMLHWLYKEVFEKKFQVNLAICVGGLVAGKPSPTMKPDIFLHTLDKELYLRELIDYTYRHYPITAKFTTYILGGSRELAYRDKEGFDIVGAICQEREDLAAVGDLKHDFDFHGLKLRVISPYDDHGPKGVSYGVQKLADAMDSQKDCPDILVVGGTHERSEIPVYGEHGMDVFTVPSLHTQMRRQERRGVSPRLGALILELQFDKDWKIDKNKGLKAYHINLDDYAVENDWMMAANDVNLSQSVLNEDEQKLIKWLASERGIRAGEISRRLKISKAEVEKKVSKLNKAGFEVTFSQFSKQYEFTPQLKNRFSPLPLKYEDVFQFMTKEGELACTHYDSKEECPEAVEQAYKDAALVGVRRMYHAGDFMDGAGSVGYPGHQHDVKHSRLDDAEDHSVAKFPCVKIKVDSTKPPVLQTKMSIDENGKLVYSEELIKEGEAWLQTDIVNGNHDAWVNSRVGHAPVRSVAMRLPDQMRYLCEKSKGRVTQYGECIVDGVRHVVFHGTGGLAYTLSSKIQNKYVPADGRRTKKKGSPKIPTVIYIGNWHCAYLLFRDQLVELASCFKHEDEFHLLRGLSPWVGLYFNELYKDSRNNLTMVVSDYRNYWPVMRELEEKENQ